MSSASRVLLLAAAVLLQAACAEPSPEVVGVTVTDSAGVTVVTHEPGAIERAERWSLGAPQLEIGAEDTGITLFQVAAVTPLEGGGVAVANGTPPQLLVFGSDGALTATLGRGGEGPGEFDRVTSIVPLAGDSLAAWDGWRLRMSVFTVSGGFARDADLRDALPSTSDGWTRLLPTRSGALFAFTEAGLGPRQGIYRMEAESHVLGTDGAVLHTLGPFPGAEMFGGGRAPGSSPSVRRPRRRPPVTTWWSVRRTRPKRGNTP